MRRRALLVFVAAFTLSAVMAHGHVVEQMFIEFRVAGNRWEAEVLFDAAYALPEMRADEEAPVPPRSWLVGLPESEHARIRAGAQSLLRQYLEFDWNGVLLEWELAMIDYESSPPEFPVLRIDLPVTRVVASGELGAAPGRLNLSVSETCPLDFVLSTKVGTDGETFLSISPGGSGSCWELADDGTGHATGMGPLMIGFTHVLPGGWDHVLFILAIFFLSRRWEHLLAQSLVFTLAHSVTLGLVTCGIIGQSGAWIEIVIALSITFVALENLWEKSVSRVRYFTIFGFGLIHGLGFASALQTGLAGRAAQNLILANVGIELAQVTILVAAWLLTEPIHGHPRYQDLRRFASLAIAAAGLWWAVS